MGAERDVAALGSLLGRPVLSLATGNKIGLANGLLIDPSSGVMAGLRVGDGWLPYESIHNFGRDAIMAESETHLHSLQEVAGAVRDASSLEGARMVADSGEAFGRISRVLVTLSPPPYLIYEVRRSLLDWLLGRRAYVAASGSHVLSGDFARLVVPQADLNGASTDLKDVAARAMIVRSFAPPEAGGPDDEDETVVVRHRPDDDGDETVVRYRDEDETIVRRPKTTS